MDDQSTLAEMRFRFDTLEKEVTGFKHQLNMYVPLRENELQLRTIQETVDRIEKQLVELGEKIVEQELELQRRAAVAQHSQASLQIKILWGTVSVIVGLMISILIEYSTHLLK